MSAPVAATPESSRSPAGARQAELERSKRLPYDSTDGLSDVVASAMGRELRTLGVFGA